MLQEICPKVQEIQLAMKNFHMYIDLLWSAPVHLDCETATSSSSVCANDVFQTVYFMQGCTAQQYVPIMWCCLPLNHWGHLENKLLDLVDFCHYMDAADSPLLIHI